MMRDVIKAIYKRLADDSQIKSLVSSYAGEPAIYTFTAQSEVSPYIRVSLVSSTEVADMQQSATFQIDAFDRRSDDRQSLDTVLQIRDRVIELFDKHTEQAGTVNFRSFIDREEPIDDDEGRYRRWSIDIVVRWNRQPQ